MATGAPSLPHPLDAVPRAINHLLAAEPWARQRLAAHAGKTALLVIGTLPPLRMALRVEDDGLVARVAAVADAEPELPPALRIDLPATALPQFLTGGREAVVRQARLEGDAEFAHAISTVAGNLRWEAEEDLARLVGDAMATRIGGFVRGTFSQVREAQRKLAENVAEYLLEERPLLVRPRGVEALADDLRVLRDDLARLEKRVERLQGRSVRGDGASGSGR